MGIEYEQIRVQRQSRKESAYSFPTPEEPSPDSSESPAPAPLSLLLPPLPQHKHSVSAYSTGDILEESKNERQMGEKRRSGEGGKGGVERASSFSDVHPTSPQHPHPTRKHTIAYKIEDVINRHSTPQLSSTGKGLNSELGSLSILESTSIATTGSQRSISTASFQTDIPINVQGEILVSLNYNCREGALEVLVSRARNLASVHRKKASADSYVKVYLYPDNIKRKTHVKRSTIHPVFNETLKYGGLTKSEIDERTLVVSVWHSDLFGHNCFLGEARISLGTYLWTSDSGHGYWFPLKGLQEDPPPDPTQTLDMEYCGEVVLNIKYVPPDVTKGERSTGALHCFLMSAVNLINLRGDGLQMEPFAKSYLYPQRRKSTKQKSLVGKAKGSGTVEWNHTFVYDKVTLVELEERSLEITIWDHRKINSNPFLGGLRLNLGTGHCQGRQVEWMDATTEEARIWSNVLLLPNNWTQATLPLRSKMAPRTSHC